MEKQKRPYYLGLDIGTESVGYAVTNPDYDLLKFRGGPAWGLTTFETASLAEERRASRTARRRLDRRQQRVRLLEEIFAPEICKLDPHFFIRRRESALFAEDSQHGVCLFAGGISDAQYHKDYPTIHHLLVDLMETEEARDIRLVYLACAWLLAHRGHFLSNASAKQVRDFRAPFQAFCEYFLQREDCGTLPWPEDISAEAVQRIMEAEAGVKRKTELFQTAVYGGKSPARKPDEDFPFRRDILVSLLCGGKGKKPKDLFCKEDYDAVEPVSLGMDEENFARILGELEEEDAALLHHMRAMYDCALLNKTLDGNESISKAKVAVYEQHKKDLKVLKDIIQKYRKQDYAKVFRHAVAGNYVAYSGNVKSCPQAQAVTRVKKEGFCEFVSKLTDGIEVDAEDQEAFADMKKRLESQSFLPKQRDSDNRVIPHQLYELELTEILRRAEGYLPLLREADEDGITNTEKILSIFRFRIPYFVGPLNAQSPYAWLQRRAAGKIYPWNFEKMVDLEASEQEFIRRMTNTCTYLPGEDVLPYCSLLYSRFMVLNELNNLKVDQKPIPVAVKQELYRELFENSVKKVTKKTIFDYLRSRGYISETAELSGVDTVLKANLKPFHGFKQLLQSGALTEEQVEDIIRHGAYAEDKARMDRWLQRTYPALSEADRKHITKQKLKEFGRLSRRFLTGIFGCAKDGCGEAMTIMEALWQRNENLMQLLSDRYTFREQIEVFTEEYYSDPQNKKSLSQRLDDLYISNTVKRQIIRTLRICTDVEKAMGGAPEKLFVEMARGGAPEQKGKRTKSRKEQILALYKEADTDTAHLRAELEAMGEAVDSRLQSDKLFLYYTQLGRCMYTGESIDLSQLATDRYNIDHIYPQSKVQDDSVLRNKVLCLSTANGLKGDKYPVAESIRQKMYPFWELLRKNKLITDEKFRRLTRQTGFTEDELRQFISRQLVETRQSAKTVAQLLKERYPETEIVYVKAGLVSAFRQEFSLPKSRAVNDLHHAKDAYLNIVVGNVYHEKFTRRWFDVRQEYSLNIAPLFTKPVFTGGKNRVQVWQGQGDLAKVKKTMAKNSIHLTRYAFCRKGGLFDQLPLKAAEGLVPRKKQLPAEKYGGYNKTTASFYRLASYRMGKKQDVMFVPIELRFAERVRQDPDFAAAYIAGEVSKINGGKAVSDVQLLLGGRDIKINTVLSMDGMRVTISGKAQNGTRVIIASNMPLIVVPYWEQYIKRLESFARKQKENPKLFLQEKYDKITAEENRQLYALLLQKARDTVFARCPGNIAEELVAGEGQFALLDLKEQVDCLLSIVSWFGRAKTVDLRKVGGKANGGSKTISAKLSNLRKYYQDIHIVDVSASGLFSSRSGNLLELL